MNNCIFFGRVASDMKKQVIVKGDKELPVVNFKIAVDREYWGGKNNKDFLPMCAYGKMADLIYDHFQKGSKILVSCLAQADSKNFYTVTFNISRVYFCSDKEVIDHEGEDYDEIIAKMHFDSLEEVEEEPKEVSVDKKPRKRSKKSEG